MYDIIFIVKKVAGVMKHRFFVTLKENKLYIFSFLIIILLGLYSIYQYNQEINNRIKGGEAYYNELGCNESNHDELCINIDKTISSLKQYKHKKDSVHTIFFNLFHNYALDNLLYFQILLVIIPSLYLFHKKIYSGFIKGELSRTSYNKFLKSNLRSCYKASLILPCAFLVIFLFCFLISGHFDTTFDQMQPFFDFEYMNQTAFYIFYFVNIFLHSIFYINIGLFFIRKYKNFLVSVLLSFFTFYASEIFLSIILGNFILDKGLGIGNMYDTLSLLNIYTYYGLKHYYDYFIFSFLLALISSLLVYLTYRRKEGLILQSEI